MRVAQRCRGSAFKDGIESKDPSLINNRQAGRRNRGRNNGRQNNGGNRNGENGNRIDSRARGNAPQLLEKYRNLARDAQLAGDRVNTEYYLQFADHYFRVIADNRARQEQQQARFRRPDEGYEDEGERGFSSYDDGPLMTTEADRHQQPSPSGEGEDGFNSTESDMGQTYSDRGQRQERPRRDTREPRQQREYREPRQQREPRQWEPREDRGQRNEQPQAEQLREEIVVSEEVAREEAPRTQRGRRPRRDREENAVDAPGLDLAVLPPSISKIEVETISEEAPAVPAAEEAPAPKRRGRPRKVVAEAAE